MGDPRSPSRTPAAPDAARIDGPALARAFAAGSEALRRQADAINAINVFPVPDGDTGTNMWLTMHAAVEEIARTDAASAHAVAAAVARGSLMGAKGNSGVILSQILAGIVPPDDDGGLDAAALADGLERARAAAYRVVSAPKEGTILTAISAAAAAAEGAARAGGDVLQTLAAAVDATRAAVAQTPELLPVLKEAGVVDSGAQGLLVLLDGALRGLRGEDQASYEGGFGAIDDSWIGATQHLHAHDGASGFCTEFVVSGTALDTENIRRELGRTGESLLVVGGGDVVRVHVHTQDPDAALAYGRALGAVSHEKVDDMEAQFQALAARARAAAAPAQRTDGIAVVAVAAGGGLEELFRSMGATVVRGGQTMNPSAGDIRAAIESTGASEVIVLPGNKNIVLAARQAAQGLQARVEVVETTSIPQGVAALVAMNSEEPLDANVEALRDAITTVCSAEVTLAARKTKLGGIAVREGQPIGIVDGELAVAEETVPDAVRACVGRMVEGRESALVTLYFGDGEDEQSALALAGTLRATFGCDVEVVAGGQPHYPYLIGVE